MGILDKLKDMVSGGRPEEREAGSERAAAEEPTPTRPEPAAPGGESGSGAQAPPPPSEPQDRPPAPS